MKTIMKIAALAVITVLVALSCAPEVTLTDRDWGEKDSERAAALTNNRNGYAAGITIALGAGTQLPLPAAGYTVTEEDRELTITFPADADFLKVSNNQLEAKLQEFLSFYTFTNPDPTGNETYVFSTKGTDMPYKLVRRNNTTSNGIDVAEITIRLDSLGALPATQGTPPTGVALKLDGAKYTFGGYGLDWDNDGNAGEATYDDAFGEIAVENGPSSGSYVGPGGPRTLMLSIGSMGTGKQDFDTTTASRTFVVASLNGGGIGSNDAADPGNLRRKAILEALIPLFEIQKFDAADGTWKKVAATITYQNDPALANPTPNNYGSLIVSGFTVEDLGIYRIYASGLKGLKTSGQAGFYGVEQKIATSIGFLTTLRRDWYASSNAGFYIDSRDFVTAADLNITMGNANYDNAGKKAVIEFEFDKIEYTPGGGTPTDYFLKEDAELFKKNVRIAFRPIAEMVWVASLSGAVNGDNELTFGDASKLSDGDEIYINGKKYTLTISATMPVTYKIDQQIYADAGEKVYKFSNAITPSLSGVPNIAFIKFSDVKFEKVNAPGTTTHIATKVILTVDEGLSVTNAASIGQPYWVIAPGFEYGHNNITFGDFTAIDTIIDGIRGWALYGALQ